MLLKMKMMVKFHRNDEEEEEEDSAPAKSWTSQVTPVLEVRCLSSSVRTYPF